MIKKTILGLLVLVVLLVGIILIKTLTFSSDQVSYERVEGIHVPEIAIDRFKQSIAFETVSYLEEEKRDTSAFLGFHRFMETSYPLVDSVLEKQFFNYSMLYKWQGTDPSLPAVVMMGHFDVVPVDESTLDKWEAPPFSGEIKNGNIYGRGTMDDKINVIALMEAAELLLKEGFQPKQTLYFSFGHDEEVGGDKGAHLIAEYLRKEGVKVDFAIDEGGFIAEGMVPGLESPLALINTGEKGYVSFKLTINTDGGHSSQPPKDNTIGSLATAITKLEANQFEYRMIPVIEKQIKKMGPKFTDFKAKMAFANSWLFGSQVLEGLNAHTTIAPTMISGGVKDNVIPTEASAVINFRIMPGESVDDVKNHIIKVINDDRIRLETVSNVNEPSPVSSDDSPSYQLIEKTILQLIPDAVVSPGLLGAGTDSKHFIPIAENVYRFYPTRIHPGNVTGFHGNNEHISLDNYKETIQFNYQLIKNLSEGN